MLLGFKKRFAKPIKIGTKVFTMRNPRKIEPKIGETLYMYSGLRTANSELISNKEKLISKQVAEIKIIRHDDGMFNVKIHIDSRLLSPEQIIDFVKFDGFIDGKDFVDYWIESSTGKKNIKHTIEVSGKMDLYHWTDLKY